MAAKSNIEILQTALLVLKERRIELAKFLISPQISRDDMGRYVVSLTTTQQAIDVVLKAIAEDNV